MTAYRLDPAKPVGDEVVRVGVECLDDAVERLQEMGRASPGQVEEAVHQVRKRCKEVRALSRLVGARLGQDSARVERPVAKAAGRLGSVRDAHAILATLDTLRKGSDSHDRVLDAVRSGQTIKASRATGSILTDQKRIDRATKSLAKARDVLRRWDVDADFSVLASGLLVTYRQGRRSLGDIDSASRDEDVHDLRKWVKTLWYQLRLIELSAPSVLSGTIEALDAVATALGDDHDLAVLVGELEDDPKPYGGTKTVRRATQLARERQQVLRRGAVRLASTLYVEKPSDFARRLDRYWALTHEQGMEPRTGGIAGL